MLQQSGICFFYWKFNDHNAYTVDCSTTVFIREEIYKTTSVQSLSQFYGHPGGRVRCSRGEAWSTLTICFFSRLDRSRDCWQSCHRASDVVVTRRLTLTSGLLSIGQGGEGVARRVAIGSRRWCILWLKNANLVAWTFGQCWSWYRFEGHLSGVT